MDVNRGSGEFRDRGDDVRLLRIRRHRRHHVGDRRDVSGVARRGRQCGRERGLRAHQGSALGRDLRAEVRCFAALRRHEHQPHGTHDDDRGDDRENESLADPHRATCEPATTPPVPLDEVECETVEDDGEELESRCSGTV